MRTLSRVAETLGPAVLGVVSAPRGLDIPLSGRLVIHDTTEEPQAGSGDLVFGIGLEPRAVPRLLKALGQAGAAALVLRESLAQEGLGAEATEAGVAVLTVPVGTPWGHVVLLIGSLLSGNGFPTPGEQFEGIEPDDLFAVANVIAEMVDAPITIEDLRSHVLAFSGRQEEADAARTATILRRRMPDDWLRRLHQQGVFRRLITERGPIYVDDPSGSILPRAAIAIRAGEEVLGAIWAVVRGRLPPEREAALVDAADFAAVHLLRHRLVAEHSGLEAELTAAVLRGGGLALDAMRRLNLAGRCFRVLAVAAETAPADPEVAIPQVRRLASFHLSRYGRAGVTRMGNTVYAVVALDTPPDASLMRVREAACRLRERIRGVTGLDALVAVGSVAERCEEIPASKATADDILRVLRRDDRGARVADPESFRARLLLLRVTDLLAQASPAVPGPLQLLREHDRRRGTAYLTTFRCYLEAFGDVHKTARALHVHRNTVHYRLRQLQRIAGLDLGDPVERLALMLELHSTDPD